MLAGWKVLGEAARNAGEAFTRAGRDPRQSQLALLARIIEANRNCEFGRAHAFDAVATYADYCRRVPIASYNAFAGAIARAAETGVCTLTTPPIVAFEETSGSSAHAKLIPYTEASLSAFRAAVLPWLADAIARHPAIMRGRAYVSISPVLRAPRTTPSGVPVGQGSDAAYLGPALAGAFLSLLAVRPEVAASGTFEAWQRATLCQLIEAEDLAFVSVWSPTFLLEVVRAIPRNAEALAAALSPLARRRLEAALALPRLATERLWPRLALISCWTDASSAVYAVRLRDLFPHAVLEGKGLLATEAAMTVPTGYRDGAVPAILSTFIEYLDDSGLPHLSDDLEVGARYRLVVTTDGGLYRYDIGDVVRCVGHDRGVPRLRFEGRHGVHSDLVGEKIDEPFAADVIARLGVIATLAAHPGLDGPDARPHYQLWLDESAADPAALALEAEALLRRNPHYAYARSIGQLGPILLSFRANHVAERAHRVMASGTRLGDVKPVALITDFSNLDPSKHDASGEP